MSAWLRRVLVLATVSYALPARALVQVEVEGCPAEWQAALFVHALELEVPEVFDRGELLHAVFRCVDESGVELGVLDGERRPLAGARAELDSVPAHAKVRVLALLWAELLATLAPEKSAPARLQLAQLTAPPLAAQSPPEDVRSPVIAPPSIAPVEAAHLAPAPAAPERRLDANGTSAAPLLTASQSTHRGPAQRYALWPRARRSRHWFEAHAGADAQLFFSAVDLLFGAELGVRAGPVTLSVLYRQLPAQRATLGYVDARIWGGALGLTVWCSVFRPLELCGLSRLELGRAQVVGRPTPEVSVAQAVDALFVSGDLGAALRLNADLLALELTIRAGFARGPTARASGERVAVLHGGFAGLTLAVAVQP